LAREPSFFTPRISHATQPTVVVVAVPETVELQSVALGSNLNEGVIMVVPVSTAMLLNVTVPAGNWAQEETL